MIVDREITLPVSVDFCILATWWMDCCVHVISSSCRLWLGKECIYVVVSCYVAYRADPYDCLLLVKILCAVHISACHCLCQECQCHQDCKTGRGGHCHVSMESVIFYTLACIAGTECIWTWRIHFWYQFSTIFRFTYREMRITITWWKRWSEMKIPATEYIPGVSQFCLKEWQDIWNCCEGNQLHAIYTNFGRIPHCKNLSRRDAVVINRLRIGHTRLTHLHLLTGEDLPTRQFCTHC